MELLILICLMASDVNLSALRLHLVELLHRRIYNMLYRLFSQLDRNWRLFVEDDVSCIDNLRMDRDCFHKLVYVSMTSGGLDDCQFLSVKEQVAMSLTIIAHNTKNRIIHFEFIRSGETISRYFHCVLNVVLRLHKRLLVKQKPITPKYGSERWKNFQVIVSSFT